MVIPKRPNFGFESSLYKEWLINIENFQSQVQHGGGGKVLWSNKRRHNNLGIHNKIDMVNKSPLVQQLIIVIQSRCKFFMRIQYEIIINSMMQKGHMGENSYYDGLFWMSQFNFLWVNQTQLDTTQMPLRKQKNKMIN